MNRTPLLCAGAAALALAAAGPALGQMAPMADPFGDATIARADAEAQSAARFDALDANKDGALAPEELAAMRPPRPAGAAEPARPADGQQRGRGPGGGMMRTADANGDGKISKDEFLAAQQRRFDQMDDDKDGKLTKEERQAFFEDMRARMMMRMGDSGN